MTDVFAAVGQVLMQLNPMAPRSHQTAKLLKFRRERWGKEGKPLSLRMLAGRPRLLKRPFKTVKSVVFLVPESKRLTGEETYGWHDRLTGQRGSSFDDCRGTRPL